MRGQLGGGGCCFGYLRANSVRLDEKFTFGASENASTAQKKASDCKGTKRRMIAILPFCGTKFAYTRR